MQTRLGSFCEAWVNVFIGYWINFFANLIILPHFGFHITIAQNLWMGVIYTGISVARSYCIRRWFNGYIVRMAEKLSGENRGEKESRVIKY